MQQSETLLQLFVNRGMLQLLSATGKSKVAFNRRI